VHSEYPRREYSHYRSEPQHYHYHYSDYYPHYHYHYYDYQRDSYPRDSYTRDSYARYGGGYDPYDSSYYHRYYSATRYDDRYYGYDW
jgi:hypothetical protein